MKGSRKEGLSKRGYLRVSAGEQTVLYIKLLKQPGECAESVPENSEAILSRQDVAQLKGIVRELIGRVE